MAENHWNAEEYRAKHAFVFQYGEEVLNLLDPRPGEKILDLGCGTGELTAELERRGAKAVGIDQSEEMLAKARQSFPNLSFRCEDALKLQEENCYDAIFSNAVLHWIEKDWHPVLLHNLYRALKPGGRFVAEFGGYGNNAATIRAMLEVLQQFGVKEAVTLYFPTIGEYAGLMEQAGFRVEYALLFDRPTKLAGGKEGMKNWIQMFHSRLFAVLSEQEKKKAMELVLERLKKEGLFHDENWYSDYVRIRFSARRPL